MKRVILTAIIALIGIVAMPESASAQFDLSKIGSMLGGASSKPQKSPYQTLAENAPVKSKIIGQWGYGSFDIDYLGNNAFASSAISQLEYYAQMEVATAGITPGCYSITLRSNGKGYFSSGDCTYESSYTYDITTAHIEIKVKVDNSTTIKCDGFIKMKDGKLGLMLKADDVVKAVATLAPEAMNDQAYITIKSVVDSFPGIYITTYYNRL